MAGPETSSSRISPFFNSSCGIIKESESTWLESYSYLQNHWCPVIFKDTDESSLEAEFKVEIDVIPIKIIIIIGKIVQRNSIIGFSFSFLYIVLLKKIFNRKIKTKLIIPMIAVITKLCNHSIMKKS
jgi:hypothetical protein